MIIKLVVLVVLVAAPASCSAGIKGYREETKGGRLIEQHQVKALEQIPQQQIAEHREEQITEQKQLEQKSEQKLEERLEEVQRQEESKGLRYEAKPQIPQEQRELSKVAKTKLPEPLIAQKEEKFEQQQKEFDTAQVVEVRQEQRRLEDLPLVQPVLPLAIEESRDFQTQQVQTDYGVKGHDLVAPLGQAEPYAFNYQVEGSSRSESSDANGVVRGQYTLQGSDGANRIVDYIADQNGFRAIINTNEFGTEARSPANVALRSSQPLAEDITLRLEGKTRESLLPPPVVGLKSPARPENWNAKGSPLIAQPQLIALPSQTVQTQVLLDEPKSAPVKRAEEPLKEAPKEIKAQETGPEFIQEQPAKSAELKRESKSLAELKQTSTGLRSASTGFESATAHREHRTQPVTYVTAPRVHQVPTVTRVHSVPVATRPQAHAVHYVNRVHPQRYPPSPVQGYRRDYRNYYDRQVTNPRVSFYSPSHSSFDDDHFSSFDHPSDISI